MATTVFVPLSSIICMNSGKLNSLFELYRKYTKNIQVCRQMSKLHKYHCGNFVSFRH